MEPEPEPVKKLTMSKARYFPKKKFENFAFYGLDMEPEPET
jgi:hypothetical protein